MIEARGDLQGASQSKHMLQVVPVSEENDYSAFIEDKIVEGRALPIFL